MKIGIISDTHDHIVHTKVALAMLRDIGAEVILHAGDFCSPFMVPLFEKWELHAVFGNNDGDIFRIMSKFGDLPKGSAHAEFMDKEFDGKRIAMYHGTQQGITNALIASGNYDLVVSGHTHSARNDKHGKTLHINPGSVNGFDGAATFAIYDTSTGVGEIVGI